MPCSPLIVPLELDRHREQVVGGVPRAGDREVVARVDEERRVEVAVAGVPPGARLQAVPLADLADAGAPPRRAARPAPRCRRRACRRAPRSRRGPTPSRQRHRPAGSSTTRTPPTAPVLERLGERGRVLRAGVALGDDEEPGAVRRAAGEARRRRAPARPRRGTRSPRGPGRPPSAARPPRRRPRRRRRTPRPATRPRARGSAAARPP